MKRVGIIMDDELHKQLKHIGGKRRQNSKLTLS